MYRVGSSYERQHRVVAVEEVAHADLIATRDPHFDQRMTGIEPRPQIARDVELPAVIDVWQFLAQARQQLSGAGLVEVDPGEADPELLLHPESLSNAHGDGCAQRALPDSAVGHAGTQAIAGFAIILFVRQPRI